MYCRTVGVLCAGPFDISYLRTSGTSISFGTIQTTETLREERG